MCSCLYTNHWENIPFPSSLVPLFQNESKCESILMKMSLIYMKMNMYSELIFIWMVSFNDSFWYRGKIQLGNGLFIYRVGRESVSPQFLSYAAKQHGIYHVSRENTWHECLCFCDWTKRDRNLLSASKLFKPTFGRWPLTWLLTLFSSPVLYEFYAFPTLEQTSVNQKHQKNNK